jgi:oxygen-independent coproporphyrinogen-3 oxidase
VTREWERRLAEPPWRDAAGIETVYFGGGTPSRLEPAAIATLIAAFGSAKRVETGAEITLEANPEDVTAGAARAWVAAGVNRVSLGVQSFDPAVLAWMHRTHTASQVPVAVTILRKAGIGNISLDLIYGLPAALSRDWSSDLDQAFSLEPDHLSLYGLTVEQGTPLGRWTARGIAEPSPDWQAAEEYLLAHGRLVAEGFEHYEVSNASRPGRRAVHTAGYWGRASFLGLGPSAHSGHGRTRAWNNREWEAWRRAVEEGTDPRLGQEELSDEQVRLEECYLGLRTSDGVSTTLVQDEHRREWVRAGWAREEGGRVFLSPEGWLRLDALVATLPGGS